VGAAKGWRVLAGGFASGLKPRLAELIATDLTDAEAISLAIFKAELGLPAE